MLTMVAAELPLSTSELTCHLGRLAAAYLEFIEFSCITECTAQTVVLIAPTPMSVCHR